MLKNLLVAAFRVW